MHKCLLILAGCMLITLSFGCEAMQDAQQAMLIRLDRQAPEAAPMPPAVLEAESFELFEAEIVQADGASGGRAVLFGSPASRAVRSVEVPAGRYIISVHLNGPDSNQDDIYLTIAGGEPLRICPTSYGNFAAIHAARLNVIEPGLITLVLSSAETGMTIDRIEIAPIQ